MSKPAAIHVFAGSLVASLLVFLVLSWPLARFANRGIPAAAQNFEHPAWRYSVMGDQLQLLYHYDLLRDMMFGRIPWFQNPYEFNEGRDEDRYRPSAYFFPMSGLYAVLAEAWGQALGWNLTLWISVCLGLFFSWMWLRRHTADGVALALGLAVIMLSPFRWISLFGGSPAGMGLMWVSFLVLGMDVAIRQATWMSGAWVGATLLVLFWADIQIFYLTALALPVIFAISALGGGVGEAIPWRQWPRVVPGALLFTLLLVSFYLWRKETLAGSTMGAGRSWEEVRLFSPSSRGFLLGGRGADDSIFVGFAAGLAVVFAWGRLMISAVRGPMRSPRRIGLLILLLLVFLFAGCLAVGVKGPWNGGVLTFAREHLPYYAMIRQPFKIFALVPLWIGWLVAVGFSVRPDESRTSKWVVRGLAMACLAGMVVEVVPSYSATICLLEPGQAAYERVAREAEAEGVVPGRLLVVPIWPGDAVETALPMYFCQKYDLRMINGYSPIVRPEYIENVYRRLESVNQGALADDQIDFLQERGIHFLLVHENMFPEKVSPFPVAETLRRLKGHPRLQFLEQAGPVHAFRLLPQAAAMPQQIVPPRRFSAVFPARRWEAEQQLGAGGRVIQDESASNDAYWQAGAPAEGLAPRFETRPTRVAPADDLAWWVRVRGSGRISVQTHWENEIIPGQTADVSNPAWDWKQFPIPMAAAFGPVKLEVSLLQGDVQVDLVLLAAGPWPREWPAEGLRIPAAHFFRAGYVDEDGETVVLRRAYDPDVELFYGPRMPLPSGDYTVEVEFSTEAPADVEVARFGVRHPRRGVEAWASLRAGTPARLAVPVTTNLPLTLVLKYNRASDLKIHAVTIARLPESGRGAP